MTEQSTCESCGQSFVDTMTWGESRYCPTCSRRLTKEATQQRIEDGNVIVCPVCEENKDDMCYLCHGVRIIEPVQLQPELDKWRKILAKHGGAK